MNEIVAGGLRRNRENDYFRVGQSLLDVTSCSQSRRQLDVGEVLGVAVRQVDGRRELLPAGQQQRLCAGVDEHLGERRTP